MRAHSGFVSRENLRDVYGNFLIGSSRTKPSAHGRFRAFCPWHDTDTFGHGINISCPTMTPSHTSLSASNTCPTSFDTCLTLWYTCLSPSYTRLTLVLHHLTPVSYHFTPVSYLLHQSHHLTTWPIVKMELLSHTILHSSHTLLSHIISHHLTSVLQNFTFVSHLRLSLIISHLPHRC